ncbi:MAG: hypothetical protein EA425_03955 [Puniceicoccaceae bacterium]|nr:MAG: hypothetical protein EA425_03955 [Puniceicoccaceae bacterium]
MNAQTSYYPYELRAKIAPLDPHESDSVVRQRVACAGLSEGIEFRADGIYFTLHLERAEPFTTGEEQQFVAETVESLGRFLRHCGLQLSRPRLKTGQWPRVVRSPEHASALGVGA